MERKKIELLAPAGDMERLKMAVAYGADAVYLAGTTFGMRTFAGNFTPEELKEAVELCKTEPKYSMGLKMCSPAVVMMLQTKKGQEKFRSWLTPEELAIFDSPECPKNFRQMIKKEKKKQGAKF